MSLQAKAITLRFNGDLILDQVNMAVNEGELIGLIGPNGAGKTSLLRVLANLQTPSDGQLLFNQQPITQMNRKRWAQHIGYLAQGAPAHWPLKVRRLVELGRLPHLAPWHKLSSQDHGIVQRAMEQAEVTHLENRVVSTLSGGERLRVLMARMFATQPTLILADEPIAALDPYHQLHTMELLREHCEQGGSAVAVLHDLNMAAHFCHRIVLIHHGKIVSDGTPEEVLMPQRLAEVYGIEVQIMRDESGFTVLPRQRIS